MKCRDYAQLDEVSSEEAAGIIEDIEDLIRSTCAGYAALVAAGYSEEDATDEAREDLSKAVDLFCLWGLDGTLGARKANTVKLMSSAKNIQAVEAVAMEMKNHQTLMVVENPEREMAKVEQMNRDFSHMPLSSDHVSEVISCVVKGEYPAPHIVPDHIPE